VLTYGYKGETMLLVPIQVAATVKPGSTVRLRAHLSWLECERICVPGEARLELTLPVVAGEALPANSALFEHYTRLLPTPASSVPGLGIETGKADGALTLRVTGRDGSLFTDGGGGEPDFYPETPASLLVERPVVTVNGSEVRVNVRYRVIGQDAPASLRGVFVYNDPSAGRQAI
jgi:thiol:disulfide interchange protein DsbD